jgi:hypothetical protein
MMIFVGMYSNGQLFKLFEVSKFYVGVKPIVAHTEGRTQVAGVWEKGAEGNTCT